MRQLLALLWFAFMIYGITDLINTPSRQCRYVSKATWAVIIIIAPIVGAGSWLYFGKVRVYKPTRRQVAPDDDLEYLASLRKNSTPRTPSSASGTPSPAVRPTGTAPDAKPPTGKPPTSNPQVGNAAEGSKPIDHNAETSNPTEPEHDEDGTTKAAT